MQPTHIARGLSQRARQAIALVLVVLLVGAGAVVYFLTSGGGPGGPVRPPPAPTVNATLSGIIGSPVGLATGRLGVDVRADVPLTSASANALNSTDVRMVRWPGGGLGDRFDPTAIGGAGLIYDSNGTPSAPSDSFAQFVAWCRSVACDSIVTLPAEVDNASLAAKIVQYSLGTLHFQPTYWEIGNEPGLWTHFGMPWADWTSAQNLTTTPAGYAQLVRAFVSAIRAVDATTPIIGIGGVGGGASDPAWVQDVVATDGPNLSAVAIHVYPAGHIAGPTSLATWFASLQDSSSLPSRTNSTLRTVAAACSSCHVLLLVDEFGSGTTVPRGAGLTGGYLASYVGAELVQSLALQIGSLDYYDLQSGTTGAWFATSGTPSAAYTMYEEWSLRIGSYAVPVGTASAAKGLLAALGGNSSATLGNLILVNVNSSVAFHVDLARTFPNASNATVELWNGSDPSPTAFPWGTRGDENFTLGPMSLVIFHGIGPFRAAFPGVHSNAALWTEAVGAGIAYHPSPVPGRFAPARGTGSLTVATRSSAGPQGVVPENLSTAAQPTRTLPKPRVRACRTLRIGRSVS